MVKFNPFILLFCLLFSSFIEAQDVHFSQFDAPQTFLNPALAGNYDGAYRATGIYRNQWGQLQSAIQTTQLSFDYKWFFYNDEIDFGGVFVNDFVNSQFYNTNKVLLNASYKKKWGENIFMGGIQTGLVFRSIDLSQQTFDSQWEYINGEFNPNRDNGEYYLNNREMYWDLNFGLAWSRLFAKKWEPIVGLSLFHINRPKDSFSANPVKRLKMRTNFYYAIQYHFNSKWTFQWSQNMNYTNKAQNMLVELRAKYHLNHKTIKELSLGLLWRDGLKRNPDAVIPRLGAKVKDFEFGISYDFNVSRLSYTTPIKSTFEISLIYIAPGYHPKNTSIPCDRY